MKRINKMAMAMLIGTLIICFSLNTITVFAESNSVAINDISMATVGGVCDEVNVSLNNNQEPTLTLNGKQLMLNTDYVVWYYNTSSVGTAKMLIIGIGDYTGHIEKEYEITGAYGITIGENVEISSKTPVKVDVGDSFDEVDILCDGEIITTIKDKDEATAFFNKAHLYTPKSDDLDGKADWSIKLYKLTKESGYRYNGSQVVFTVITKRHLVCASEITAFHSPVTKLSWAETQPIVHKNKIFIQPKIHPIFSYDQELTWNSSNTSVATVDNFGVVTILKPGTCLITASTSNGLSIKQELDIEAMDIMKVASVECVEVGMGEYSFILSDRYGVMNKGVDYEISYRVKNNIIYATFNGKGLYAGTLTKYFDITNNLNELSREELPYELGDVDANDIVTDSDAEYLLMYTFFPEDYPVNQECDFNGDGKVNDADAEHLLMFTFFPEDYPLH